MPLNPGDGRIRKHARSGDGDGDGDGVGVVTCLRGAKE